MDFAARKTDFAKSVTGSDGIGSSMKGRNRVHRCRMNLGCWMN